MANNDGKPFESVPIPNSTLVVVGVRIKAATGRDRVGKIEIKPTDDAEPVTYPWEATYIGDKKWKISGEDVVGNEDVQEVLTSWLNVNGRGDGGLLPPPIFPDLRSTPPVPKPDSTDIKPPRKVRQLHKPVIPKPEQAVRAPVPQPKKKTVKMNPINNPTLRGLVNTTCKVLNITKRQLRDTSDFSGTGGRKIVCNVGSYIYDLPRQAVAEAAGFKNAVQVNQTREIEDPDLQAQLSKVTKIILERYPKPADDSTKDGSRGPGGPKKNHKSRPRIAKASAVATITPPGSKAGANGNGHIISPDMLTYICYEASGRSANQVSEALKIPIGEVHRAIGWAVDSLGESAMQIADAIRKCSPTKP